MAANQQILREYLLSLGFRTNNDQQRVFDGTLKKTHFTLMGLGKAVFGAHPLRLAAGVWSASGIGRPGRTRVARSA